jgi:hypothetical protein
LAERLVNRAAGGARVSADAELPAISVASSGARVRS